MAHIVGTTGNDNLADTEGNDHIELFEGDDSATVTAGVDRVEGGPGTDTLVIVWTGPGAVFSYNGPTETAPGSFDGIFAAGFYSFYSGTHVAYSSIERFDITTGSGNDNILIPHAASDRVILGEGNDFTDVGSGNDTADGGPGIDGISANLAAASGPIVWNVQTNSYSGPIGNFTNFEYFGRIDTGSGNDNIVTGLGNHNEILVLGDGDDIAAVFGGFDQVYGHGGIDTLIIVWTGSAALVTVDPFGPERRVATGAAVGDLGVTYGGIERLEITAGSGNDDLITDGSDDRIILNAGDDSADVGSGNDYADGGTGTDRISANLSSAAGPITWNLPANTYSGPVSSFTGFEYFGTVTTGSGNDLIVSGAGSRDETINLGAGDDQVTVSGGHDIVSGGTGTDTLVIDWRAGINPVAQFGAFSDNAAEGGFNGGFDDGNGWRIVFTSIESLDLTTGSANDNIATFHGDDRISTGAGNDSINAGAGNDMVDGGAGNDSIRTDAGNDMLDGGAGSDLMVGGSGNDVYVVDQAGDLVLEVDGEGTDEVRTALGDKNAPAYALYYIPANVENLVATSNAGQGVGGNALNNIVTAGSGQDLIAMHQGGVDNVNAGAGADFIWFGNTLTAEDVVNGGLGRDTLAIQGPFGYLTLGSNVTGIERLELYGTGTEFSYNITLADSVNAPHPNFFEVVALSLGPNEHLRFDGSSDTDSRYFIRGGAGEDTLFAGAGNDRIVGNDGNDLLMGNAGNDILIGGMGQDRIDTGAGTDTIEVLTVAQSTSTGHDIIFDFDPAVDRINVSGTFAGWGQAQSGALSSTTFDATLAAAVDAALGNSQAVRFFATSGDQVGKTFVVYDANGDGAYTAGTDYVFQFFAPGNLEGFSIFI